MTQPDPKKLELLPCFCGKKPKLFNHGFSSDSKQYYIIFCRNRKCLSPSTGNISTEFTKDEAIKAWNVWHTKTTPSVLSKEFLELLSDYMGRGYSGAKKNDGYTKILKETKELAQAIHDFLNKKEG